MHEPTPTPAAPPRTPWLRLMALVVLLLALNIALGDGLLWLSRPTLGPGSLTMRFAVGWRAFSPVLAALWLTWGGGSIAWRLPVMLALVALERVAPMTFDQYQWSASDFGFQMFLVDLMEKYLVILTMHAAMMPIRGYLGYQFSFQPPAQTHSRRGAQWTLFDIIGFTAFAAFPIAFARLIDQWINAFEGRSSEPIFWIALAAHALLPMLPALAMTYLLFSNEEALRRRFAVVVVTALVLVAMVYSYHRFLIGSRTTLWDHVAISLGMTAATFTNLGIIRLFGVRKYSASADTP